MARAVLGDQEKVVAKVEESWGCKALQLMFSLVNATDKLENDRHVSKVNDAWYSYYISLSRGGNAPCTV